jgi:hypothetical protein
MEDRKISDDINSSKLKNKSKMAEAKHIQELSLIDQEMFIKLFYHKVKEILDPYAFDENFYGFPFDFLGSLFFQFNNTPEKQCNELMKKIKNISTFTADLDQRIHFLESSFHKVSLLYEQKQLMPHTKAEIYSKIVYILDKNFIRNRLQMKNLDQELKKYQQLSKKVVKQLSELQDLYNFPSKYIDSLKKEHTPVHGYTRR